MQARRSILLLVLSSAIPFGMQSATLADEKTVSALEIFQRRIVPIFKASNPSSCSECHLSGVDLKQYIQPTQEATFASLKQAGLVDPQNPEASKLLQFIRRTPEKPNLITAKVRQEEYEAFRAWIVAAVRDPQLAAAKASDSGLSPQLPVEVIRHARTDRVLSSFIDNVWSEIGRCAACHSPDRNQKQVKEHGEQVSWIKLRDPQATLDHLVSKNLIDVAKPEASLLLTKPTMQVEHGGGIKLVKGDRTYTQFRTFIEDYAAVKQAKYKTSAELPAPAEEVSQATEIWLKLTEVPAQYDKLLLQADLYRFDEITGKWSETRFATGDRQVAGGDRRLWQQHLSVAAPRNSERAAQVRRGEPLPPGRYLVKIYIDRQGRLQQEYPSRLGSADLVGQVEVNSRWPAGYGQMTAVKFPSPDSATSR